ncbi:hypothetical protein DU002_19175 [Corallincola holothuriorum]|uniref:Lipoprotein n=1 Tax=Corallincola holothuriorum TaxID=2282215 RepID=A0A368MXG5_9GAMM|nr:hypothetical protein [Corallincola holothuriorum]RCU42878.1 hypothetical protein DU002_19175 [Corallincola holothuriorum]
MKRYLVVACILSFLTSCAVYHPQRGIFVSSSVQTVTLDLGQEIKQVELLPFSYPDHSSSTTQSEVASGGGVHVPVSHTYVFDEVDRQYLRESVIKSFEASGVAVVAESDTKMVVEFKRIGMMRESRYSKKSVLSLDAVASLVSRDGETVKEISVHGEANATIASSKNQAVRVFLEQLSGLFPKAS